MNKREAKIRGLNLCMDILKAAIDDGTMVNMVDDDTSEEDAEKIIDEADEVRFSLLKRIQRLNDVK